MASCAGSLPTGCTDLLGWTIGCCGGSRTAASNAPARGLLADQAEEHMTVTTGRLVAVITSCLLAVAQLGCGSSKHEPGPPPPATSEAHAHGEGSGMGGMCPMDVPGTKVSVADTPDGVALTFTTTGDVSKLREHVYGMAAMHEHMMQEGSGSGGMGSGGMMMKMVPSTARSEDVEGGARIVLTPKDAAQLSELRAHVREHATQMTSGHCPMMMQHRG